ncbi:MAG: hypothetical protein NC328_05635 [Muribaculum sp.]|nr:hypothetical protein [Muribaculum sp.]
MKKNLLLLAALSMLFSSCLKDSVDERTTVYQTVNLVIPNDQNAAPTVNMASYTVKTDMTAGTMTLSCPDVVVDGIKSAFTSDAMPFRSWTAMQGSINTFSGGKGMLAQLPVTGVSGAISGLFYYPAKPVSLPGINFIGADMFGPMVVLQYNIGDTYKVKTFNRDMIFAGDTQTHYSFKGEVMPTYTTQDIMYRLVFHTDFKKADLVLYNAKFAAEQPFAIAAMVLKDLDVEFNHRGYIVSGKNVEPQVPENDEDKVGYTTYDSYTFKTLLIQTTTEDLTGATIDFTVENPMDPSGDYRGQFNGAYVLTSLSAN